jgi:predicted RNA-binding Zn ribbon-like protein
MRPDGSAPAPPSFDMDGGALCLDFANTAGNTPRRERLPELEDFLRWSAAAGLLDAVGLKRARRQAAASPRQAQATLARARALREALYRIFSARARGAAAASGDLDLLNDALRRALPHQRVVARRDGFAWDWDGADSLEFPLWPIARSAAHLLVADEAPRVQECAAANCSWLFVDRSRGARRRWCDMKSCGNRAKARRFYERSRRGRRPQPT